MRGTFRTHPVVLLLFAIVIAWALPLTARASTPVAGGDATPTSLDIEGLFDVGGHSLYLQCTGTGSPTIIYLHGYSQSAGDAGGKNAAAIPSLVQDRYRFCVYDRANTGRSDDVPGPMTGEETVRDLHLLLQRAGIAPPFVLLGASFGGLVAYQYALTYPDQVSGMLLLDALFPDELTLEAFYQPEERLTHDMWPEAEEQIDQLSMYETTMAMRGNEPDIPVIYLLATPSNWQIGNPAYDDVVLQVQAEYVAAFPGGEVIEVASSHYMEGSVPEAIANYLDVLVARIGD